MNIINQISRYIRRAFKSDNTLAVAQCPNCWGREEYDGQYYEARVNQTPTIKAGKNKLGWIQEYAAQNLSSVSSGETVCPKCRVAYQAVGN